MSGSASDYYNLLTRTDHPVFAKDYTVPTDATAPINSIWNWIIAQQAAEVMAILNEFQQNLYPQSVTAMTIDDWEIQYFGYTKPNLDLPTRVAQLLIKFNKRLSMAVSDVITLAQSITGMTPLVIRNVSRRGWVLGQGVLGRTTVLSSTSSTQSTGVYMVVFTKPVPSNLLAQLDSALTAIDKGGSRHVIKAPIQYWKLGSVALGINTTLK